MTKVNIKIMDLLKQIKDAAQLKTQLREIFAPPAMPQSAQEWESEWGIILSGEYDQDKWLEAYYEQHKRNLLLDAVWQALEWSNFKNLGALMRKLTREALDGETRVWFMKYFEDLVPIYDLLWQFDKNETYGQYWADMISEYTDFKWSKEPVYNNGMCLSYVYTEWTYKKQCYELELGSDSLSALWLKIRERDTVWYQFKRACIDFTPEDYFKDYFWKLNEKYETQIDSVKMILSALWTVRSY